MCRYAFKGPYKDIFACFNCHKSYKQRSVVELTDEHSSNRKFLCPQCSQPMYNMGHDFKTHKSHDNKKWKKVEKLYRRGFTYHSCGCGPGYRPKKLREVEEFLEGQYEVNEGMRLLKRLNNMNKTRTKRKYKLSSKSH